KALIANHGDLVHPGTSVSVINVATKSVSAITDAVKLQSPLAIAISPDGSTAYATNRGQITGPGDTVAVIDVASKTDTSTVTVPDIPISVAVTPDGAKVYVTGFSGAVSVIHTGNLSVTSVDTTNHPLQLMTGAAVTPDGGTLYVAAFPGEDIPNGVFPE